MDADFSVELGPPDEEATLELPWNSGNADGPRYLDLKRRPHLLALVEEAVRYPALAEFLRALNSPDSPFQTAKCDAWATDELAAHERVEGALWKFASYVDVVFDPPQQAKFGLAGGAEAEARFSFVRHEQMARALAGSLKQEAEIPAAAEFIIRRCYYHCEKENGQMDEPEEAVEENRYCSRTATGGEPDVRAGFYLTFYLSGYGRDQDEACRNWELALRAAQKAMLHPK